MVVACGLGVDLDLVPLAADTRAAVDPDAELVLVVARGDLLRPLRELADHLRVPARWVEVDPPWVEPERR